MTMSSRYTLNEAVGDPREWSYSWGLKDDVRLQSCCDFCGQEQQRLTYEVVRGSQHMWICHRCVGRYPVGGEQDGQVLDLREARDIVHGLTARLKQRTCHDIIREVQATNADTSLEEILVYFERNLQLSPQRAALLFAAMGALTDEVDVRIFEVQTRSNAHQDEFGAMDDADRNRVWPALSPQQKRRLMSLGHAPQGAMPKKGRGRPEVRLQMTGPRMSALTASADMYSISEKLEKSTT